MKTITINVTAKHVAEGVRENCRSCPIALAMEDAGIECPKVYGRQAYGKGIGLFKLTAEASYFVSNFDWGRPVSPATFVLEVE